MSSSNFSVVASISLWWLRSWLIQIQRMDVNTWIKHKTNKLHREYDCKILELSRGRCALYSLWCLHCGPFPCQHTFCTVNVGQKLKCFSPSRIEHLPSDSVPPFVVADYFTSIFKNYTFAGIILWCYGFSHIWFPSKLTSVLLLIRLTTVPVNSALW